MFALIKNVVGGSGFQSIKHVYYSYQLFNLFHLRFPSKKITKLLIEMQILVWKFWYETIWKIFKQMLVLLSWVFFFVFFSGGGGCFWSFLFLLFLLLRLNQISIWLNKNTVVSRWYLGMFIFYNSYFLRKLIWRPLTWPLQTPGRWTWVLPAPYFTAVIGSWCGGPRFLHTTAWLSCFNRLGICLH